MTSRDTFRSALLSLVLGSNVLACAHRATTREDVEPLPPASPGLSAGVPGSDAGMSHLGRGGDTAGERLMDAATPLQRELALRPDVVSQSMQQHDNPRALATVRCQQQERCGFVRQGGKYILPEQCLTVVLEEQRDRLVQFSCTESTDTLALQSCFEAVRTMDCAAPFGGFDDLAQCSPARICRGTNAVIPAP
ncbi:MAG TPA: DUF6184 family natural product biosynthesis lipoprotein [Polyangiales bacterium]|nr:DUF6184 family natural product biosynthesis lipoprotein [Polyangiales bacterium]